MIRIRLKAFRDLQGDSSDTAFAKKLGISRSQWWRICTGKSSVGGDFIEKFMLSFPNESLNDYFFVAAAPLTRQNESVSTLPRTNFFAQSVPCSAQAGGDATPENWGENE